jgi:hypothetical protein
MIFTEDPVEFIYHYATYTSKDELRERIQKHIEYKTCKILFDEARDIYAACLWNISPDGLEAYVIDMCLREDYRNGKTVIEILKEGLKIWPVKFLRYNRDYNNDGHDRWREPKII